MQVAELCERIAPARPRTPGYWRQEAYRVDGGVESEAAGLLRAQSAGDHDANAMRCDAMQQVVVSILLLQRAAVCNWSCNMAQHAAYVRSRHCSNQQYLRCVLYAAARATRGSARPSAMRSGATRGPPSIIQALLECHVREVHLIAISHHLRIAIQHRPSIREECTTTTATATTSLQAGSSCKTRRSAASASRASTCLAPRSFPLADSESRRRSGRRRQQKHGVA